MDNIMDNNVDNNADNIIIVKDLAIAFSSNFSPASRLSHAHSVIKNISFKVCQGEKIAIMGGSGSGKSVLMKAMVGLIKKSSGMISIKNSIVGEGKNTVEEITKKHNISITFQHDALFDSMNILENLRFVLLKKQLADRAQAKEKVYEAIDKIGLERTVLDSYPSDLSGGMRKRIAIARALITKPNIAFFDEPTTGLDPITSNDITDMMGNYINLEHVTSIIITHSVPCAKKLADKIIMIHEGEIKWFGQTHEIDQADNAYVQKFLQYALAA